MARGPGNRYPREDCRRRRQRPDYRPDYQELPLCRGDRSGRGALPNHHLRAGTYQFGSVISVVHGLGFRVLPPF